MKDNDRKNYLVPSMLLLGLCLAAPSVHAKDIGMIQVDSTTIDDRFESKRGESSSISVIGAKKVEQSHAENIKQVLDAIPGLTTELQSQDSLKIHIRGVENQRFMGEKPGVAIVIDGVPVFERTGRVNINMDDIESIKIIKGGASYLFGDDALAGAVIITTKRGAKMAGLSVSAEGGSFAYKRGVVRGGFANDKMAGHIQFSRRDANGYYFQGDYKADYLNGKLQYYTSDSSDLTFGWEVANRLKDSHGTVSGITQAALDPSSVNGRDFARHYNVKLGKFYLTYANDVTEHSNLMMNLYQFGDHTKFWTSPVRFDAAGKAVTDVNAYAKRNDYKQTQRGFKTEWRSGSEKVAWMLGLDLRDNNYQNRVKIRQDFKASPSRFSPVVKAGTLTADNDTSEKVYATYGELKYQVMDDLTLSLNARFDRINLGYDDFLNTATAKKLSKSFNVSSWRTGLNYAINDNSAVYTNISTGFRAPTINQLFAGSITLNGNVAANPNLKPEQAFNYEIGVRGQWAALGGLEWDLSAFQIDRKDFILNAAGQYATPNNGIMDQYKNIGGMRNRGVELALNSNQDKVVSVNMAYTYLDARFSKYDNFNLLLGNRFSPAPGANKRIAYNNSGKVVPRVPKHKLFLAVHLNPIKGLQLSSQMNTQSAYFADEINQEQIGGHTVFNLLANYELKVESQRDVNFSLFTRIDNLFDRTYFNSVRGYTDSNGDFNYNAEDLSIVVNTGRRFTAGITASF
ncbi:MAG: TonB-dependent receptor [Mariprofundaceae bacterium]|nr:TonB-dependent receptor [Mariprofundaceae bacterium]